MAMSAPIEGGWQERTNPTPWYAHPDYPGWYAWRGVPGTGYYARRQNSSPPLVAGPAPDLAVLGDMVALASR